jgi:hypothetical protein
MTNALDAIFQRRAIKIFDPVEIPAEIRDKILDAASELQWMRTAGFTEKKIAEYERRAKFGKWFFIQGWFGVFGALKWVVLRLLHVWKTGGTLPVGRQGLFKWATKSTALACQNFNDRRRSAGPQHLPNRRI